MSYRGENLIFIISQPKAGSTLLQRLVAGHPDIQTSAETWLMLHPVYGLRKTGIQTNYNANWAATGVQEFVDNYADGKETYNEGVRSFAETIYGSVLEKHGKRLFLDKTPRYTMIVDELYELFPKAKYILLLRNPLAILKSELHTYVKGDWPVLSQFAPDLLDAPGRLVDARSKLGPAALEVRYEDLVTSPGETVRSLCDFLAIEFDSGMLNYSDTPAPKGRMNDPVGIHKYTAPSKASLDKWKELGADGQLRHFALQYLAAVGDETITALGYDAADLRRQIEQTAVDNKVRHLYPWSIAIKTPERWSFRDHVTSTYVLAAQQRGRLAGVAAVMQVLAKRIGDGLGRLVQ
ncbi:MAG: sulfotransferase [Gammaproteobacteria bacterium]|nr:sulfotransferase [Gammaproteobacteria bacterium]